MIPKLILNTSFNHSEAPASIVPFTKHGPDSAWLKKHAEASIVPAIFNKSMAELKIKPNRTVVHIIALADEETAGPNRNADGFSKDDCVKKHHTFVDLGHLFANHKNTDPAKAIGEVLASAHNDPLGRTELLVAHDNDKDRDAIQQLAEGKDLAYSMGSLQQYDVCSVCKHKAPTAKDHCDHIKNHLNEVLADGRKVYMQNPNPEFFDISRVFKPADRVAYMLRKVAMEVQIASHELAEAVSNPDWAHPKYAMMARLASIEKHIPAIGRAVATPNNVHKDNITKLKKLCSAYGVQQVLWKLAEERLLLAPADFAEVIVGHPDPVRAGQAIEEYSSQAKLAEDAPSISAFDEPAYKESFKLAVDNDLRDCCSMDVKPVTNRSISLTIIKKPKLASLTDVVEAQALASLYRQYKLAFAVANRESASLIKAIAQVI